MIINHAVRRLDIGGADLLEYLNCIWSERGYSFDCSYGVDLLRRTKVISIFCNDTTNNFSSFRKRLVSLPYIFKMNLKRQFSPRFTNHPLICQMARALQLEMKSFGVPK